MKKVIPTSVHGIIDYVIGILLLIAPGIWKFSYGPAVTMARVVGAIIIIQPLFTRYEAGLFRVLPMPTHLVDDYVLSIILAASPWIFGFANQPNNVWMPHLILGIVGFFTALFSEPEPRNLPLTEERRAM